ncbi:MAG TPA: DMT family protein [Candidatus Methylacidiphilales bacterium]|nr:DMT family protein [Candidatus Methylacidiphilales bacterium]
MYTVTTVLQSVLLLTCSNIFMTFAWYGHLKYFHDWPAWKVIPIAWSVAFFEYCFQVPANRIGFTVLDGYKLKIMQEVITLVVFVVFARFVLGEELKWNYMVSFALLAGAAWFAFAFKS